jgi:catechol 2,3-dioxygenase-like lactoylglutathione lyase family enzyme
MIDWYVHVFEAEVLHRNPALAFLTFDEENHRFAIADLDVLKPGGDGGRGDIGVNHIAFTYARVGDLLETYARLKAAGIRPYWPIHHGITLSLYYQDPDENRVELQVDVLSPDAARDFMGGPVFAANPVGVRVDPDALLAAYRAGADEATLLSLPVGAPSPIPEAQGLTA